MPGILRLHMSLWSLVLCCLVCACDADQDGGADGTGPERIEVSQAVDRHLWDGGYYVGGDWDPDFNDGAFYGTAYYIRQGLEQGNTAYVNRAEEMMAFNAGILRRALQEPLSYFAMNLDAVAMAMLGSIEYAAATGEPRSLPDIDAVLNLANAALLILYGNYVTADEIPESYFMETYGATVATSVVALANLQYAVLLEGSDKRRSRVNSARKIVAAIETAAWNGEFFKKDPGNEKLFLYPNVMMMLCYCRLYQATGEPENLEKAEVLFQAIQPLKRTDRPGYTSPYSAQQMGAATDDYSTLSSQNYLMFALALLSRTTGKVIYCNELREVRRFVEDYLLDSTHARLLHHWMDGQIAQPTDPEYFCSGCNLQFLYMGWWADHYTQCAVPNPR